MTLFRSLLFLLCIITAIDASAIPNATGRTFGVKEGLPSNSISDITQDRKGIIWLGTWNGLACYDGYNFYPFRSDEMTGRLTTNRILKTYPDGRENIWFTTYDHRVSMLDILNGTLRSLGEIPGGEKFASFSGDGFFPGKNGFLIEGVENSLMQLLRVEDNAEDGGYRVSLIDLKTFIPGSKKFLGAEADSKGRLWIFTDKGVRAADGEKPLQGAFVPAVCHIKNGDYIAARSGALFSIKGDLPVRLASAPVPGLNATDLIGVEGRGLGVLTPRGLYMFDPARRRWQAVPVEGGVVNAYADSSRRIWIFTGDGRIGCLSPDGKLDFPQISPSESGNSTSMMTPLFNEDRFGTVWMAPAGGGLVYFDEESRGLKSASIRTDNISGSSIPDIEKHFIDRDGNLWLISINGLTLVNFGFKNYNNISVDPGQETRSLASLDDGTFLAGSYTGLIGRYNAEGKLMGYLSKTEGAGGIGRATFLPDPSHFSTKVYSLFQDRNKNIWVGTKGDGLYIIKPGGELRHYSHATQPGSGLACDTVYAFDNDSRGNLWIGTYGKGAYLARPNNDGSYSFIPARAKGTSYPAERGFAHVRRITHDDNGNVFLSTNDGIVAFDDRFKNVGDIKFHAIRPKAGDDKSLRSAIVMQTLVGSDGTVFVTSMGGDVQTMHYDKKTGRATFEPVADRDLRLALRGDNVLSMIEDRDGNYYFVRENNIVFHSPKKKRTVIYGSNTLGGEQKLSEALPVMAGDGVLYFGSIGHAVKLKPNNLDKDPFTPDIVFTGVHFPDKPGRELVLNSDRIEVESGQRDLSISFAALDYAGSSYIEYAYRLDNDTTWNYLGKTNTLQMTNLKPGEHRLYVRSTNSDGTWVDNEQHIDIYVHPTFWESVWGKILIFIIIAAVVFAAVYFYNVSRRNRLMQQLRRREHDFYVDASHKLRTPLSLIGSPVYEVLKHENLSEVGRSHLERVRRNAKNMLEMLNTMLDTKFNPDIEETPKNDNDSNPSSQKREDENYMQPENWLEVPEEAPVEHQATKILIVEDNDDLRGFLSDILAPRYNIITAENGRVGLEKAETEQPDFILTDISMPEMDGLTMVKKIKSKKQLSHIPIIVLSARASVADRVQGLAEGIDDYISKPFSATLLRQRIANIISQRRMLQQSYLEQIGQNLNILADSQAGASVQSAPAEAQTEAPAPEPREYRLQTPQIIEDDQIMMEKLMKFLEERISDENLRIEEMAEAVSMGRTVFYGKIKAIVGMAPSDFLRSLRMRRAEDLIVKSKMNFSQIVFSVGFNDPKYFTKCFKKETGMTPSEYRKKMTAAEEGADKSEDAPEGEATDNLSEKG